MVSVRTMSCLCVCGGGGRGRVLCQSYLMCNCNSLLRFGSDLRFLATILLAFVSWSVEVQLLVFENKVRELLDSLCGQCLKK